MITKNRRRKQPSTHSLLYKRAKSTPKRTYKRKSKQQPTQTTKKASFFEIFGFFLVPMMFLLIVGGIK